MFRKIFGYLNSKSISECFKHKYKNTPLILPTVLSTDYLYSLSEDKDDPVKNDYLVLSDERISELNKEGEHSLNRFMHFLTGCVVETSKRYRFLLKQQLEFLKTCDDPKVKQQKEVDAINNRLQLLKKALEKYDKIVKNIGFMAYNQAVSSYLSGNVQPDEIVCANTQIPPPYSSAASLEGISVNGINEEASTRSNSTIPRSASIVTANAFHLVQHSPGNSSQNVDAPLNLPTNKEVSITNNPCYMQLADTFTGLPNISGMSVTTCSTSSNLSESDDSFSRTMVKTASSLNYELEVGSREYGNKFSGLLNLSVCTPSNKNLFPVAITATSTPHDLHHYSVANSATSSGVSSLANLSTPASPPQATSPTAELRELLDKIQQLPHRKSPDNLLETRGRSCFGRSKAKTLYMPLNDVTMNRPATSGKAIALFGRGARSWLSQSAPNTPSGNFMPSFPVAKKHSEIQKGSKGKVCDGRPLLNQNEESDEELPRKHCL